MSEIVDEFAIPMRRLGERISSGEVVGLATDTTYALVAALSSRKGVEALRDLRALPPSRPLAMLMKDLSQVSRFAYLDNIGYRLMKSVTPGRYTFILRATKELPRLMLTNQRTVGIRICGVPIVDAICETIGEPLVSASAATKDGGYAESAEDTSAAYPKVGLILDGGRRVAEPSTVIDLTGTAPKILREGAGPVDFLAARG